MEYCYFTPEPEAGLLGGRLDIPTLNIIGTKESWLIFHGQITGGIWRLYHRFYFLILICWVMFEPGVILLSLQDQYFGPEDSVAKIVTEHGGYGDRYLTGNGFKTMVRQGVKTGLVCSLELLAKSLQYASVMIVMCPCQNSEPWLISYSHLKSPASIRLMGL